MTTYISILRGINVGVHKRIKMEVLRKLYEDLGFKNVHSYIQSGNIVFQTKRRLNLSLSQQIEKQILINFDFEVPVFILELTTLKQIIEGNPYDVTTNKAPLHLTLLSNIPDKKNWSNINKTLYLPVKLHEQDQHIYLFCPNGYGKTKLTNNFFENKLKTSATTRNWKTIVELMNIATKIDLM